MKSPKYTIQEFHKQFPDNETCIKHLFETHHGHKKCPKCGQAGKYYLQTGTSHFVCQCGGHQISPKAGTIFEKSDTDLVKWYFAIFLMSQSRNGVAAKELERQVGVTYKTAWRMQKQIRLLMLDENALLSGEVEADEAWIGGRRKRKEFKDNKTIVFGAVQRKGKVNTRIIKDTTEQTLLESVRDNVAKGSKLMTDDYRAYKTVAIIEEHTHSTVNHSNNEWKKGDTHTNTIEGFWSQIKRSIDGTYHVVSPKYLPSYLAEFQFRYNHGRNPVEHLFSFLLSRVGLPHVVAVQRISSCR
jgi:transposase-like protein